MGSTPNAKIRQALTELIGLTLAVARRAADMRVIHFGTMRPASKSDIPSQKNKPRGSLGGFALHIQCPWRIESDNEILTGRSDLWEPHEHHEGFTYDEWDYEKDGNLQDHLIDQFVSKSDNRTVEGVSVQSNGAFTLVFSCGYRLAVFPSGTVGEDWRLVRPSSDEPHLVVSGGSIECEEP
jgi:hypothetical protein